MTSRFTLHVALMALLASAALPLHAGTGYVPVAADNQVEGVDYDTVLWISNVGTSSAGFSTRFIPTGTDGTPPAGQQATILTVPAGGTFFLQPVAPAGAFGLLEVTTDPGLVAAARLIGTVAGGSEGVGAGIPVLTSKNVLAANDTAVLQGLERSTNRRSNVGFVNLGDKPSLCTVGLFRAGGTQIQQTALLQVPPFGQRDFYDALAILGVVGEQHVRLSATCDQPFFVYATLIDRQTGEISFRTPSGMPDLAGGGPAAPPPALNCPTGATCFQNDGTFYVPSRSNPIGHVDFPLAVGQYKQVHLTLDVKHGVWYPRNPSGNHNIFWMVRDINRDMFGFLNVKGPGGTELLLRHGFGQNHVAKARLVTPAVFIPGTTYRYDYLYDTAQRIVRVIVTTLDGAEVARLTGAPDISNINIEAGNNVFIEFGFKEGLNPNELPTYGWEYQNMRAVFTPK